MYVNIHNDNTMLMGNSTLGHELQQHEAMPVQQLIRT